MSNSPIIPREKLSAYQRWEMRSFDEVVTKPPAPAPAPAPAPTDMQNVQELERRAFQRGRVEGRNEGLNEGLLKAAADSQHLRAALAGVGKQSVSINQQLTDDLIELALDIARRMVHDALDVRRELIVPVVQDALEQLARPLQQPMLTLHPDDASIVREHLGAQLETDGWKIIEDPGMECGGCKVQTLASQVDGGVAARWQHLAAALGKSMPWIKPDDRGSNT